MMGRESKGGSAFSWADEVEKEEEEEAAAAAAGAGSGQAQLQQWRKPNPFGSTRPREVVLQAKGIDWRKLDLHLQQPSPLPHESYNKKLQKQSNPQPDATTALNSKLVPARARLNGSPTVSSSCSQPQVILTPQIQSPTLFVPPLRYPPKYVAGIPYEPGVMFTAPNASSGYQHFTREKENRSQGGGKFHNLKSESAMCGNSGRITTELVQSKGTQEKGIILGESGTRKGSFHGRNSFGLPLVNRNIGSYEMHDKRISADGRQPRNIQDDLGMDGTENNEAMEHKWQKVTKKLRDLPVKQVNNGERDTAYRKIKGERAAGLGRNKKKNFVKNEIQVSELKLEKCS